MQLAYSPIGTLRTCFTEKFGVPRQSLMIREARGVLKLNNDPSFRDALNRLSDFSHLWVLFEFHHHRKKGWRPTVRPPRLDAPRRVGVFASRSPHRPNPIGMSVVQLDRIDFEAPGGIELHVSGVDILDGTPVLDIKPYIRYADSIPDAREAWAEGEAATHSVDFLEPAIKKIETLADPEFRQLLVRILELDPRPMSQRRAFRIEDPSSEGMEYGFRIRDFDVKWRIQNLGIQVIDLV